MPPDLQGQRCPTLLLLPEVDFLCFTYDLTYAEEPASEEPCLLRSMRASLRCAIRDHFKKRRELSDQNLCKLPEKKGDCIVVVYSVRIASEPHLVPISRQGGNDTLYDSVWLI